MQQVEVDVVGLKLLQLLVENAVEILRPLHEKGRKLGGEAHLFAVSIAERTAHDELAFALVIGIGGINVIHAIVDGMAQHANGFALHRRCRCRACHPWRGTACSQSQAPKPSNPAFQTSDIA